MIMLSVSVSVSVYLLSLHILLFLWALSPELKRMCKTDVFNMICWKFNSGLLFGAIVYTGYKLLCLYGDVKLYYVSVAQRPTDWLAGWLVL